MSVNQSMKISVVDQQFRPKITGGCNYGAAAWRMVVYGDKALHWTPGFKYWASSLQPSAYSPAALSLHLASGPLQGVGLATTGRLSRRALVEHLPLIMQVLGVPPVQADEFTNALFTAMTHKRTVLLEDR